jgi:hypothetical protein
MVRTLVDEVFDCGDFKLVLRLGKLPKELRKGDRIVVGWEFTELNKNTVLLERKLLSRTNREMKTRNKSSKVV